MDLRKARTRRNPAGPSFVTGAVAGSSQVIEAFRCRHDRRNNLVLAGESLLHGDIDVWWLPAASETYAISDDPRDYVLVDIPIVTVDIPNRNMQAFPYEEVSYFDPLHGRMVYQTFGGAPCLTGDALVPTERGLWPIEDLGGTDAPNFVMTRRGKARIKNWAKTGYRPVFDIMTESGASLTLTANHPVLVLIDNLVLKWKDAGDLREGDWVVMRHGSISEGDDSIFTTARKAVEALYASKFSVNECFGQRPAEIRRYPEYRRTESFPLSMTTHLARLLGYLASEGNVGEQIGFSNTDIELIEDFVTCWEMCFGYRPAVSDSRTPDGKPAWRVTTGCDDIRTWLSTIGMHAATASTKTVPLAILRSKSEFIEHFLLGYIEGDGCWVERFAASSVSRTLLEEIKLLIEALGFSPRLIRDRSSSRKGTRPKWVLYIPPSQSQQFANRIGFVSKHRAAQMSTLRVRSVHNRGIPFAREFCLAAVKRHAFGRGRSRRYYDHQGRRIDASIQVLAQRTAGGKTQAHRFCREHVEQIAPQLGRLNPEYATRLLDLVGDFRFERIVSIGRPTSIHQPVYDIETTSSQFVANGIVVHNCHIDHDNKDPLKAKGVMFDAALQYVPAYNVWKIRILAGWDRTKDPWLVRQILTKKRTGYSMGALVNSFVCSVCGAVDTNIRQCPCMKRGKGSVTTAGALVYQLCCGAQFIECSSVDDPADITADTDYILE